MARPQVNRINASGLALPLALVYCGLVAYASLYPFTGWQSQGVKPWSFVLGAWPKYWSGFDVAINVLGYIPLGFLLAVARRGAHKAYPAWFAIGVATLLSFVMEGLQTYLALRVSSNVDWLLNTVGAAVGAMLAFALDGLGFLKSWSRFRGGMFAVNSGAVLGLLVLWPLALLYPTPVPLGLGYGFGQWLEIDNQVLNNTLTSAVLALGFLTPLLMAYAVTPRTLPRLAMLAFVALATCGVTTLSNGLSFGPEHATVWLQNQSLGGVGIGAGVGLFLILVHRRLCWVLAFLGLVSQLFLVNIMAEDPYFAQTLAIWDQGRFIRFYGATQWLGLLWPYAALFLITVRLASREKN